MCFSSRSKPVDTSAQEAELARQTAAIVAQYQQFMQQQQEQFNAQRAEEAARYEAIRRADIERAQEERRVLEQQLAQQNALITETNARAEAARVAAETEAKAKATRQRQYADGRNVILKDVTDAIDAAYGGFDDSYFGGYRSSLVASEKPSIDREFADRRTAARLSLSDRGNLSSSAAAKALAGIQGQHQAAQGSLSNKADGMVETLRNQISDQKRSALTGLLTSASVAPENDDPTDVPSTLADLSSRLSGYLTSVQSQVQRYAPLAGRTSLVSNGAL